MSEECSPLHSCFIGLTDPVLGSPLAFAYRADGHLATEDQPTGNNDRFAYDAAGRLALSTASPT